MKHINLINQKYYQCVDQYADTISEYQPASTSMHINRYDYEPASNTQKTSIAMNELSSCSIIINYCCRWFFWFPMSRVWWLSVTWHHSRSPTTCHSKMLEIWACPSWPCRGAENSPDSKNLDWAVSTTVVEWFYRLGPQPFKALGWYLTQLWLTTS